MNFERVIAVRTGKTVYRDGNRVIKVFDSDYSKADVLTEALNCARVEQTGLDIAKILEVTMIDGKWAILSEYIEGKPLDRLMKENPDDRFAEDIGSARNIHNFQRRFVDLLHFQFFIQNHNRVRRVFNNRIGKILRFFLQER